MVLSAHFQSGRGHRWRSLYFCNSIGAAVGVLIGGFFLIPRIGLPGTGARRWSAQSPACASSLAHGPPTFRSARRSQTSGLASAGFVRAAPLQLLLAVSLLDWRVILHLRSRVDSDAEPGARQLHTGLRADAQRLHSRPRPAVVSGSGGWSSGWRIPCGFLGGVQVAMGVLAVATLPVYGWTLPVMRWLVETLPRTSMGYLRVQRGESRDCDGGHAARGIFCRIHTSTLYATLSSDRGAVRRASVPSTAPTPSAPLPAIAAAVHIGLPMLGLKLLIVTGAAVDIGLGLVLLWLCRTGPEGSRICDSCWASRRWRLTTAGVQLDTLLMASGVFRAGQSVLTEDANLLFHRDGKTATVHVTEQTRSWPSGRTEKSTPRVEMLRELLRGQRRADAGALRGATAAHPSNGTDRRQHRPRVWHDDARLAERAGNGGRGHHRDRASDDRRRGVLPTSKRARCTAIRRSRIVVDDAKTFFSTRRQPYDIIVSEPSNPWVSGTASLFSIEFYRLVRQHLSADGLFVQWLQLYSSTSISSRRSSRPWDGISTTTRSTSRMGATFSSSLPAAGACPCLRPALSFTQDLPTSSGGSVCDRSQDVLIRRSETDGCSSRSSGRRRFVRTAIFVPCSTIARPVRVSSRRMPGR